MLRRLLSILLLAVFGLPFVAPLLALGQGADAGLPACCRRSGAHHCAMSMGEREQLASSNGASSDSKGHRWKAPSERCPYCPASVADFSSHDAFVPSGEQAYGVDSFSHPTGAVQTESKRRIARDRSRQKRGPPSFNA